VRIAGQTGRTKGKPALVSPMSLAEKAFRLKADVSVKNKSLETRVNIKADDVGVRLRVGSRELVKEHDHYLRETGLDLPNFFVDLWEERVWKKWIMKLSQRRNPRSIGIGRAKSCSRGADGRPLEASMLQSGNGENVFREGKDVQLTRENSGENPGNV